MNIKYHWDSICRYGLLYEMGVLLQLIGAVKDLPVWAVRGKEQYFLKLPVERYEEELNRLYYLNFGRYMDFMNPKKFTEKIQWLKLNDQSEIKTILADKYLVRNYVDKKIGKEYLIPLLGVWDKAEDIPFDALPNQFILKCNHGSGMNIIVKDKQTIDKRAVVRKINQWLSIDFGLAYGFFELQYSKICRKVIAEELINTDNGDDLNDYKFFCFDGKPEFCKYISNRSVKKYDDYFSEQWEKLDMSGTMSGHSPETIDKPLNYSRMWEIAEILSEGFPFVRVDLYNDKGRILFGEMTFTPYGGFQKFNPASLDDILGEKIHLK